MKIDGVVLDSQERKSTVVLSIARDFLVDMNGLERTQF